jgi:hypothetical protein
VFDFLVRAYVPHAVLAAVAALLFHSQPAFPDETWAKTYGPLRERTAAAADRWGELNRRLYTFDRDTPQGRETEDRRRKAEQECRAGHEALRPVDERLANDREPVYRARRGRALLLCVLIILSYVLTDLLVSPAGGMRLLPDATSYAVLVVGAFCVPQVLLWLDCGEPARASVLFFAADGLALAVLLFARDAFGVFEGARAHALAGAAGARGEAEQFYAAHRGLLGVAFPEALWRASLNAAIPDGTEPAQAWAAARMLIRKLLPLVAQAREVIRLEEERTKAEAPPPGPDPVALARAARDEALRDVIAELRMGLPPEVIADALEGKAGAPSSPARVLTPEDYKRR